jgi:hypothetical protein
LSSFAVKHVVADHGALARTMKDVRKTPFSFTSKEPEASAAARGGDVYVIEVSAEGGTRTYALGYKYRAYERYAKPGGALWRDEFKFKNSAVPGEPAQGVYFDTPVVIDDAGLREWLATKLPSMAEIPAHLVTALEVMVAEPANNAKHFA